MTTSSETPTTYTFGRRDRGGLLIGLRANQLICIGTGCAGLLLGLLQGGARGGAAGAGLLAMATAIALVPIQGRAIVDWVRPVANHLAARALGRAHYLGGAAALHRTKQPRMDLPGLGQNLRIYETERADGSIAAVRIGDRWIVVLKVRGSNYVLSDRTSQERRIRSWGALLSQSGQEGSHIAAVQWLERTLPDSGHDLEQWWLDRGDPKATYAQSYEELIARAGPAATRHEAFVAVAIDAHKMRRSIRQAGGGPEGTTKVLLAEVAWVRQALTRAEVDVLDVLDARALARVVRGQYDPTSASMLDAGGLMPSPTSAGPLAAEQFWDYYRSDSAFHAVFWVADWPSVPVEAAWVYPLIALGGIRRTISVTAEPIPPSRSLRELRGQRVAKRADLVQRRRIGQLETAQDDEEYDAIERRERELVRGHTEYRFTGWITVTALDRDALEAACAHVEQAAVRSALQLRRVYGEPDQAFLRGGLPLAHGVTP